MNLPVFRLQLGCFKRGIQQQLQSKKLQSKNNNNENNKTRTDRGIITNRHMAFDEFIIAKHLKF